MCSMSLVKEILKKNTLHEEIKTKTKVIKKFAFISDQILPIRHQISIGNPLYKVFFGITQSFQPILEKYIFFGPSKWVLCKLKKKRNCEWKNIPIKIQVLKHMDQTVDVPSQMVFLQKSKNSWYNKKFFLIPCWLIFESFFFKFVKKCKIFLKF